MSDDTLIEDLVRAGVSAELVGRVARVLVLLGKARNSAELTEQRRAKDRERKKKKPSNINDMPKANDVGSVGGIPGNSAEAASEHCESFFLSSPTSESAGRKKEVVEGRKRGMRIPPDWQPSTADLEFAAQHGVDGRKLAEEFVDFWIAVPGQRGTKLDWSATYRNRVRATGTNGHGKPRQRNLADLALDLADEARELERKAGIQRSPEPQRRD